jgi:hypothetical protein
MSAVLDAPAFSAAVDLRSIVVSGLAWEEIRAGQVYTLMLRFRGSGPVPQFTAVLADRDGTAPVWDGHVLAMTDEVQEFRTVFTALADATVDTVLRLSMPTDQIEDVGLELELDAWFLFAGDYRWNWFAGDGEAGLARTGYHVYQWEGAENDSVSVMNRIGADVSRQILRENWRALRKLLWTPGRQIELTRHWTDADGTARTAVALAQYASGLAPDVGAGGTRAEFSVDLKLTDPFFYDVEPQVITVTSGPLLNEVEVLGDYRSRKMTIKVSGPNLHNALLVSPISSLNISNNLYEQQVYDYFLVDVEHFSVVKRVGLMDYPWTYMVTRSGIREFFGMDPGEQNLTFGGSSPDLMTAEITYYPAWI